MKRLSFVSVGMVISLIFVMLFSPISLVHAEDAPAYTESQIDDAASYVRSMLKSHSSGFSIKYRFERKVSIDKDLYDEIIQASTNGNKTLASSLVSGALEGSLPEKNIGWEILGKAAQHNGKGNEGDYLINNLDGSYGCSCYYAPSVSSESGEYYISVNEITFTYSLEYYTTKEQEDEFIIKANSVISELGLSSMSSDYDKVSAIYSYIAENVSYDYEHLADASYMMKQSAYAALINKTAVCQGYASLFYYLANAAGLDCRVVKGDSKNNEGGWEHHAWNLVKVDGKYYFVDVTWDSGREPYVYFLEGSASNKYKDDHNLFGLDKLSEDGTYQDISAYDVSANSYYSGKTLTEINNASVTITNAVYNNGQCSADVNVVLGGKTLVRNIDYKVMFTEYRAEAGSSTGTGYLNITGIGLYQSTIGNLTCEMVDASGGQKVEEPTEQATEEEQSVPQEVEEIIIQTTELAKAEENADQNDDKIVYAVFDQEVKKGLTLKIADFSYKVTKAGRNGTLTVNSSLKKQSETVIPDMVNIDGVNYKVTAIANNAFKCNTKLKSVTIGKNVTKIGTKAFYGCKNVNSIIIKSKSLKSVGNGAFKNVKNKAKVTVPKGKMTKYKKLLRKKGISNKAKFVTGE